MNPFFAGWRAARRRAPIDMGERGNRPSTWRLVMLELGWVVGQLARPSRSLPALAVGVITAVVLAPITPGPVLGTPARVATGAVVAVVGALVVHLLLGRAGGDRVERTTVVLTGLAAASVLVGAVVVLTQVLSLVAPRATTVGRVVGGGLVVDRSLAIGAALLVTGVVATGLGDRVRLPGSLALLGVGMVVGSDGLGWVVVDDPVGVQAVAVVALVVILYEGGLRTRVRELRGAVAPGVLLASVGVAVTAAIVSTVGVVVLDLELRVALLLAAVIASTDASAVFAVLRTTPVSRRLGTILQIESGTNDPIAVLLTIGLLSGAELGGAASGWVGFAVAQLGIGVGLGVAIGLLGARLLRRVARTGGHALPVLALAIGGVAYGATAIAGGSGFLAVYVCGIVIAARTPDTRRTVRAFHAGLATVVEVGLFLLLGLLMFPSTLPDVAWVGIVLTVTLVLVARPVAVCLTLIPFGIRGRELVAVSWLGMRGAVPIVLATVAFSAGFGEATFVLDVVFVVVLVSILVQGVAAPAVVKALGVGADPSPRDRALDLAPVEGADGGLIEVTLDTRSELVGRRLDRSSPPPGVLVTAVVRRGRILVPRGATTLIDGDHLVVVSDRPDAVRLVERWASPSEAHRLDVELAP